jgi:hypothetical protein
MDVTRQSQRRESGKRDYVPVVYVDFSTPDIFWRRCSKCVVPVCWCSPGRLRVTIIKPEEVVKEDTTIR